MEHSELRRILSCPMQENGAAVATVGEYLSLLLSTLWLQTEGFSGKRPFGDSGWQYEVYTALARADIVPAVFDEDGYIEQINEYAVDELILQVIREMGRLR